jgi:hypothetical protein
MTKKELLLIKTLWERLTDSTFSTQRLAKCIRSDGGHDMSDLSEARIAQVLDTPQSGVEHDVTFAFSELLNLYAALPTVQVEITKEQVVGWVVAALIIADALDSGETELQFQFDKFIDGFMTVRSTIDVFESIYIFQRVFNGDRYDTTELLGTD